MTIQINNLTKDNINEYLVRPAAGVDGVVMDSVKGIVEDVIARGDAALLEYTAKFDGVQFAANELRVSSAERDAGLAEVPASVIDCLRVSAARIRDFHSNQIPKSWMAKEDGVILGQQVNPIGRVGLYVPGGLANYPSSVLMNAIPAQIAGVPEIALCVPPDGDGKVSKYTLAAAAVIGIDEIYRVGGAQAIAAMAYGTATIKRVDKITGPGNIYVATAKKLVVGAVDIDMIAGPTEVIIVADGQARPGFIAADMIAQAEHDPLATAILLTDNEALANAVAGALKSQLKDAARAEIAGRALNDRGRIYILDDSEKRPKAPDTRQTNTEARERMRDYVTEPKRRITQQTGFSAASLELAVEFINRFAPEHLEIMTADADDWLPRIKNAGAIFLGPYTPEAIGDYVAGSNHVLPTGSTARFYSPLGVYDFIKWSSVLSFTKNALVELGSHAVCLADAEGLEGHGRSVKLRLEEDG